MAMPGSIEKQRVLARRAERGEDLEHPADFDLGCDADGMPTDDFIRGLATLIRRGLRIGKPEEVIEHDDGHRVYRAAA